MARLREILATRMGAALAALFLCLLAFLPGQTTIPPIDRDEPRFAQATRQMIETGDYVNIRYLDQPRHLQPVGIYWLQAAAVQTLGSDAREIWPHRVVSWLAAIGVVMLAWRLGAMLFGRDAGRIAAALMGACLLLNVEARLAKIDATLAFVTLAAQLALARFWLARDGARPGWGWSGLLWGAVGAGILLKGPIILLVTGGTALALALVERRARWLLSLRPLSGLALVVAIAAPWLLAINAATGGAFLQTALGYSVAGKVVGTHQAHGGPTGYHTLLFPALFWPSSLFALLAAPFAWIERRDPAVKFCLAWILPSLLVFELSGTKLPHYTLPLLPAAAMLAGAAIVRVGQEKWFGRPRLFAAVAVVWTLISAVLTVGLPAVSLEIERDGAGGALLVGALAFLGALLALALVAQGRARAAVAALVVTALVAHFNLFGRTIPRLDTLFMAPRVEAAARAAAPCAPSSLVTYGYHEPSLVFLHGPGVVLATSPSAAAEELAARGGCTVAIVTEDKAEALWDAARVRGLEISRAADVDGANFNERGDQTVQVWRIDQRQVPK